MAVETEDDYLWAVTQLRDVVQTLNSYNVMVFVTNREIETMNAMKRFFPAAYSSLCIWQVNKTALAIWKSCLPHLRDRNP